MTLSDAPSGTVGAVARMLGKAPVPVGRRVHLEGRGTTFVREVAGPPGAPALVLLHGWLASGGLNWVTAFPALSQHFRVIAPDLRGHGRGLRSRRSFHLADCADDVAALLEVLDVDRAVVAGYSMGGPVAQLLWRRHPDVVAGLVLVATGDCFVDRKRDRLVFVSMMGALVGTAGLAGFALRIPASGRRWVPRVQRDRTARSVQRWAVGEIARHDWRSIFEAGRAIGVYDARRWVGAVDVPTAVVVTRDDAAVPPGAQRALARRIPTAHVHEVDGGHIVCATEHFGELLLPPCLDVAGRAGLLARADGGVSADAARGRG